MLFVSGASLDAGMPSVGEITQRVRTGDKVMATTDPDASRR
jgi:hypothetical protein